MLADSQNGEGGFSVNKEEAVKIAAAGIHQMLEDDSEVKRFLLFAARFHHYSFHNRLLIYLQRNEATLVGGMRLWNQKGRHVKKGEKAIWIYAPLLKMEKTDKGEKKQVLTGFRIVPVFDVSQTEGEPIPPIPAVHDIEGSDTALFYRVLGACPFPVTFQSKEKMGESAGAFYPMEKRIEIAEHLSIGHQTKTLLHEWAHGLLHGIESERVPMEVREIEAEGVAFVLSSVLGLDTYDYSITYMTLYGKEEASKIFADSMGRILKTVDTISDAIAKEEKEAVLA